MIKPKELVALAEQARERSYCPYSRFAVGAALLCADGTVFTGCNIENAAFGPSVCAERTAIFKAVSDGVCRQVLREFCADDFPVYMSGGNGTYRMLRLSRLLPASFRAEEQLL